MFTREVNDYEQLYKLDVLGVEDRGENDQLQVLTDFGGEHHETRGWSISSQYSMDSRKQVDVH